MTTKWTEPILAVLLVSGFCDLAFGQVREHLTLRIDDVVAEGERDPDGACIYSDTVTIRIRPRLDSTETVVLQADEACRLTVVDLQWRSFSPALPPNATGFALLNEKAYPDARTAESASSALLPASPVSGRAPQPRGDWDIALILGNTWVYGGGGTGDVLTQEVGGFYWRYNGQDAELEDADRYCWSNTSTSWVVDWCFNEEEPEEGPASELYSEGNAGFHWDPFGYYGYEHELGEEETGQADGDGWCDFHFSGSIPDHFPFYGGATYECSLGE